MKNIQSALLILCVLLCFNSTAFAQAQSQKEIVIVKKTIDENGNEVEEKIVLTGEDAEKYLKENSVKVKEKVIEKDGVKEMTVEVTAEGEGYEEMILTIDDQGTHEVKENSKVIFIDGDGEERPDEVREMLLEKGIDIDRLIEEGESQIEIKESQKYKVVEIDDDGNKKVIEWNGEGEMPEEMKDLMEQEQSLDKMIKKKVMVVDDEDVEIENDGRTKKIKIIKEKDGNVSEDVFEIDASDDLPAEVLDLLKEHGINPEDLEEEGQTRIEIEIEEERIESHDVEINPNKAQLGVLIDDEENVRVVEFIENGAAKDAGIQIDDIIVKLDKTNITDLNSLLNALSDKKPGDVVKLKVLRNGKTKKIKVALKKAEQASTSIIDNTSNSSTIHRTEHKLLKIEGGDIVECKPEEDVARRERLTDKEIEVVEERIIEDTGMKQVTVINGSNTLQIGDLDLFPNPTDGTIRVRFQLDNQEETKVQIIDIAGRALYENNLTDFTGTFDEEIDLSGKGMGTLVLVISQGDKAFTEKIMLN